jgi:hypothetical protein
LNIGGLTLLGTATKQDHENFAILAEVDPIARAPIDFAFRDATPGRFDVRKVTFCDLFQSRCDLGRGRRIQPGEPSPEGAFSLFVDVLADFDQQSNDNTYVILLKGKPWL